MAASTSWLMVRTGRAVTSAMICIQRSERAAPPTTTQERSPLLETATQLQAQQDELKNRILQLRESIQGYASRLTANLPDWDATALRLRDEHRGILAAIRNHDGERAAALVAAHIEGYYREAGVRHAAQA